MLKYEVRKEKKIFDGILLQAFCAHLRLFWFVYSHLGALGALAPMRTLKVDKLKCIHVYLRSDEEFAHENSKGPVVDGPVMALVQDDLWGHVLGGATERPRSTALRHELGEAKINLKISVRKICNEKVFIFRDYDVTQFRGQSYKVILD